MLKNSPVEKTSDSICVTLSKDNWRCISNILSMLERSPDFTLWSEWYQKALENLQEELFKKV